MRVFSFEGGLVPGVFLLLQSVSAFPCLSLLSDEMTDGRCAERQKLMTFTPRSRFLGTTAARVHLFLQDIVQRDV